MYNTDLPNRAELPGTTQLLRSTLLAAVVATVLLIVVILPAEYAVDPTGIGRNLGLTQMGEIKRQLAAENAQLATNESAAELMPDVTVVVPAELKPIAIEQTIVEPTIIREDTTVITLKPGEATEIKLIMVKDATVNYQWTVAGGVVNFDTHADNESIDYHGYGKGKSVSSDQGVIKAAFDGHHGWFWRNRDKNEVTVSLTTKGTYTDIKKQK